MGVPGCWALRLLRLDSVLREQAIHLVTRDPQLGCRREGVRKVTLHDKPVLAVKQGSVSGTVNIAAKAVAKATTYFWQYSSDDKTWTNLPITTKAKTGLSGLTPLTLYYFRFQSFGRDGLADWSAAVQFVVK